MQTDYGVLESFLLQPLLTSIGLFTAAESYLLSRQLLCDSTQISRYQQCGTSVQNQILDRRLWCQKSRVTVDTE